MTERFSIHIDAWDHGQAIPTRFAFGKPGTDGPFATSDNVSPRIAWSNPPAGTRSFAIVCHDPDVPSVGDDVNVAGRTVPADLPRVPFYHWVLVDIPSSVSELPEGAASSGVVARGKPVGKTEHGATGRNDYTNWFASDPDMSGTYGNYDGPCPPWNDSIVHHYHFEVFALDIESLSSEGLGTDGDFHATDALQAMAGHVLAQASHMGTYSMNPDVR